MPRLPGAPTSRAISLQVMRRLRRDGERIAKQFGLPVPEFRAERAGVTDHYGVCSRDGRIRIRLRHAKTGRVLKYSSLVNTLCHELAHLRHFHHGELFKRFYFRLLRWARKQEIYRPATATGRVPGDLDEAGAAPPAPRPGMDRPAPQRQLALFPPGDGTGPGSRSPGVRGAGVVMGRRPAGGR